MIRLLIVALVAISATACVTDNSYSIGDDTPLSESGKNVDPFDSAHSPG